MTLGDTIAAVSTPPGRGGIGIVRLSGPQAVRIAESVIRFPRHHSWKSWAASLGELISEDGSVLDQVVVIFYASPRSYTAEDVVEIACHGAPVLLNHCLERAISAGARLAEPGEFTLRAFLKGRIDLPQAEAVRDLIDATTLYQAKVAAQQLTGSVSRKVTPVKEQLLELIALLEAGIDFAEDDVPVASDEEILSRISAVESPVAAMIDSFSFGRLVHQGLTLAIVGKPNVGKSSLFNRLLRQERAIVTDIPGTTRDLVSETAALDGIPIRFVDTAGVREADDPVESLGVERSFQAMADADLTLVIFDLSSPASKEDYQVLERARSAGRTLLAGNKKDLTRRFEFPEPLIEVSALTGEGVPELRRQILEAVAPGGIPQETGFITSLRHEQCLRECRQALGKAREAVLAGLPHELLLLDLYAALRPLDAITGATTAEDILHRIFSTFCIGK